MFQKGIALLLFLLLAAPIRIATAQEEAPLGEQVEDNGPIGGPTLGDEPVGNSGPIGGPALGDEPVGNSGPIGGPALGDEPVEDNAPVGGEPLY